MVEEYFAVQLSHNLLVALPLTTVETVTRFQPNKVCPLPGVAPFWLGIINQQGSLLWVLDTDMFFELVVSKEQQEQTLTAIILSRKFEGSLVRVAWIVKKLEGMVSVPKSYLKSSLIETLPSPLKPKFQKVFPFAIEQHDRNLIVLDSAAFFETLHSEALAV